MSITLPPYTGNTDLDYFNAELARQVNAGELAGGTGTATTGEDDEAYPTVDGLRLGYQERYLATRYGTSATGADFTDDYTAISGLTVFQGLRNSDSVTESTNPADYTWRELDVVTGWIPSYRIAGGRLVDWDFSTATPTNYIVDNIAGAIDLDDFAVGADGAPGEDAVFVKVEVKMPGSLNSDPTGWLDEADSYKNNAGADKALVAIVVRGDTEDGTIAHDSYTYTWRRNGITFAPNATQRADTGVDKRVVLIDPNDVEDNGDDAFTVEIDIP